MQSPVIESANKIFVTIKIDNLYSPYKVAKEEKIKCRPMSNVMAALPNIGGALCSTPQSLADAQYWSAVQ